MNDFIEIYNLDWKKYNNIIHDSISFKYFPKKVSEFQSETFFEAHELKEEKLIYIPVAKNASTSIVKSLDFTSISFRIPSSSKFSIDLEQIDIPEKYKNEYKFFTISRDPNQRWVSGFNEFLSNQYTGKVSYDDFLSEIKTNKFIFDVHTIPQLTWLNFCFKNNLNITVLKLDENLNEKISNLVKKQITIPYENISKTHVLKLKNYKFCYDSLIKYCMRNKSFLDLYQMDFYLYNNSL